MTVQQLDPVIEQLIRDNPKFHYYTEEQVLKEKAYAAKYGYDLQPGLASLAVHPDILRGMQQWVSRTSLTIETGCGHTTVALSALAKRHISVTPDQRTCRAIEAYMDQKGLSRSNLSFLEESSGTALPKLSLSEKLDFAYIDGCHGYPFPALDWHFIDPHLKVGGIMAFDNTEIPTVKYHCDFLDANRSYALMQTLVFKDWGGYSVQLYRKEHDEDREWDFQAFNEKKLSTSRRSFAWRRPSSLLMRFVRRD
jgi:Methyltransferase domain